MILYFFTDTDPAHLSWLAKWNDYWQQRQTKIRDELHIVVPRKHSNGIYSFRAPTCTSDLLQLCQEYHDCGKTFRMIGGSSERQLESYFGIEKHWSSHDDVYFLSVSELHDADNLRKICVTDEVSSFFGDLDRLSSAWWIGSAVTVAELGAFADAQTREASASPYWKSICRSFSKQVSRFASGSIRSFARVGGNIVTASPISDLNPLFMALDASFWLFDPVARKTTSVRAREFFVGYRRTMMPRNGVLLGVEIALKPPSAASSVNAYKVSRRYEDDISIVTAAVCLGLELDNRSGNYVCDTISVGLGGMAPVTKCVTFEFDCCLQKSPADALDLALEVIETHLTLPDNVPGGQAEYRTHLCKVFMIKAFHETLLMLQPHSEKIKFLRPSCFDALTLCNSNLGEPAYPLHLDETISPVLGRWTGWEVTDDVQDRNENASKNKLTAFWGPWHGLRGNDKGFNTDNDGSSVSAVHSGSLKAVVGQVKFLSDYMGSSRDELFTYPILSRWSRATVVSKSEPSSCTFGSIINEIIMSTSVASLNTHSGFRGVITHLDVPGNNRTGAVVLDEDLFAVTDVYTVGQLIGLVVCTSEREAKWIASNLENSVHAPEHLARDVDPVLSIEDAIARDSFHPIPFTSGKCILEINHQADSYSDRGAINGNDIMAEIKANNSDGRYLVIKGHVATGPQQHFYFETQQCCVYVSENRDLISARSSTQDPAHGQKQIGHVIGSIDDNSINVECERIGGGFGGKETTASNMLAMTAVAAWVFPGFSVYCALDRKSDFLMTGGRHPMSAWYEVAYDTVDECLECTVVDAYLDGGWSTDLSHATLERLLLSTDNAYAIGKKTVHLRGKVAKTNKASNTAFRGFGGPQGMMISERIVDHIACELHKDPQEVRLKLLYRNGDMTPYHDVLVDDHLYTIWKHLNINAKIEERKRVVNTFNDRFRWRKRGIAMVPTKYGCSFGKAFMNQGVATVMISKDGSVRIHCMGVEMGQGLFTKLQVIASRVLCVPMNKIRVDDSSTRTICNGMPTAASMGTDLNGAAVEKACLCIRKRIAHLLPYESLSEGSYFSAPIWATKIHDAYMARVQLCETAHYSTPGIWMDWTTGRGSPFHYHSHGVACTEVEVDILTGEFVILRTDLMHDVGNSVNSAIDLGQIEGAFTQGQGWLTSEELMYRDDGSLLTVGPSLYKIPSFQDVPKVFNVELLPNEQNKKTTVFGSKAVGEPPLFLASSVVFAIMSAVRAIPTSRAAEATWINPPLTTEKIALACASRLAISHRIWGLSRL
eukprot:GHVH01002041.1.p1 GENE.GHVH01002041.1~~GHVH01002041.1.p1  ORF type:complete len:1281 (+),score=145.16 GHVH01002041.1:602-4444(+)